MSSFNNQGSGSSRVFAGRGTTTAVYKTYAQSAPFIAFLLRQRLPVRTEPYIVADIGSYKGELWQEIARLLPEYTFYTIAIDINEAALAENPSDEKIATNLTHVPLPDRCAVALSAARNLRVGCA